MYFCFCSVSQTLVIREPLHGLQAEHVYLSFFLVGQTVLVGVTDLLRQLRDQIWAALTWLEAQVQLVGICLCFIR